LNCSPPLDCIASLVDRTPHDSELIAVDGKSYGLKEAEERSDVMAPAHSANRKISSSMAGRLSSA
jgi:hypothetical protein